MSQEECFKVLQKFPGEWFSARSMKDYLELQGHPNQTINSYNENLKRLSKLDCIEVNKSSRMFQTNSYRVRKMYRYVEVKE